VTPAVFEGRIRAIQNHLFRNPFVDDIAHALAVRQTLAEVVGHAVHPHGRHGHRRFLLFQLFAQFLRQRPDAAKIRRRQRGQRRLVEAGLLQTFQRCVDDVFRFALPHGTINGAGLTEATPFGAAARNFDGDAVVHDVAVRHENVCRERVVVDVFHDRAFDRKGRDIASGDDFKAGFGIDLGVVQRRYVHAFHLRQLDQNIAPRQPGVAQFDKTIHDVRKGLFAVADQDRVEKVGHGFGTEGTRPTADHQRLCGFPFFAVARNATEVQHGQNVGVFQLVLERKANDIEFVERHLGFDGHQR